MVRARINSIIPNCPWIQEVRGLGAMIGIEIVNQESGTKDKARTNRIHKYALEHGLIMITAGTHGNVIRTLMPLTIDNETLNEGLHILTASLAEA